MRFDFDDTKWTYLMKYDAESEHKILQKSITITKVITCSNCNQPNQAFFGSKGVDILGILNKDVLLFIEATNYRGYERPKPEDLANETAQKVRDTLAGIVGGARNSTHHSAEYKAYLDCLGSNRKTLQVVLWLEENSSPTPRPIQEKREKRADRNLENLLKKRLNWLTTKVYVVNHEENPYQDSLTVEFL